MDFSWTDEQSTLHEQALEFARARLRGRDDDDDRSFARATWRALGDFGALGACLPRAHGGLGLDALTTARVVEGLGHGARELGLVFSACAHLLACAVPVAEHGSAQLQREVLPALASGEQIGANAITEAGAGSDVFSLRTTARRDGDDYVLDGAKSYVTNGPVADQLLVYASTNPAHGYLGISAFLVDARQAGVTRGEPFHKTGLGSSPICPVYLRDVRVPGYRRLGAEGGGAAIFQRSMAWERACLFAAFVGAMARDLELCLEHARGRQQFRKPIGRHQAVAHRLADMKLRLEGARLLLYRACWRLDRGELAALDISLAKLAVSEAAVQSGLDVIRLHGGLGYMSETGLDNGLRDALGSLIFSGTSEIQRDLIARGLGL
ncbi:MAG: acyl-CoA dehydrogenase family protein [Myxococcales bacterium]|nr:acyl-CoA dehydrogenase family protein [Myxococcales bacterium]